MNIFVLEDSVKQQTRIEKVIIDILEKYQIIPKTFEISSASNQLIQLVKERGPHQLFFLNIKPGEVSTSFQVAKQIRIIDPYSNIVFFTEHSEFIPLSFLYHIAALDYIDKKLKTDEWKSRIEAVLIHVYLKDNKAISDDSFYFQSKYVQIQYPFNDIYYIETSTQPHRVILYTKTDRLEFTASLTDILQKDKRLLQCHRSFVINPKNVVKIDRKNKQVYFPNGLNCFISRKKLYTILEAIKQLN